MAEVLVGASPERRNPVWAPLFVVSRAVRFY